MANKIKISVIGLGEIGDNLISAFRSSDHTGILDLKGVDIDDTKITKARKKYPGYSFGKSLDPFSEYYFVCVWMTDQVIDVLKDIYKIARADATTVIESTLMPGTVKKIKTLFPSLDFVVFPHRYNGQDPQHHIFNLKRVMGGSQKAVNKTIDFLVNTGFMPQENIYVTSAENAELCKPLENAYRYAQIAIAEQMRMMVEKAGYNWDEVRAAINTKWNIEVLEARDGIGKHCLPKDVKIIDDFFDNELFGAFQKLDSKYRQYCKKKGK